ncbi:MAG: pyridoxine 5'-phosphate synthase [candidate division Zixibacteria bacterium SM23_73_2]|nr:MAG: pyridoxine 5'-phosphate synthase [candidate division Zixibacteria bacterium SM23_73_2]
MIKLSINVDHVATLREARRAEFPQPKEAALLAIKAGADGITIHLRGDRRHIKESDLEVLKKTIQKPLNLEMAANPEMLSIAKKYKPNLVTLVPEKPEELTTEGGLDVNKNFDLLDDAIKRLREEKLKISLFINPDSDSVNKAAELNADFVELNTDAYAEAGDQEKSKSELENLKKMAKLARGLGLGVNAGHGLNYQNIKGITIIEEIEEVSIGHAIVARAVIVGFEKAVGEMLELLKK